MSSNGCLFLIFVCLLAFSACTRAQQTYGDGFAEGSDEDSVTLLKRGPALRNYYRFGQAVPIARGTVFVGQQPKPSRFTDSRLPSAVRLIKRFENIDDASVLPRYYGESYGWRRATMK